MSYEPPPAPDQPPYGAAPGGTRPAELLDRFLARLIDGILTGVVNAIIVSAIVVGALMGESGGFGMASSFAAGAIAAVLSTALYLGYYSYMESSRGQTVGKMVMKLRTVGPNGRQPHRRTGDPTQHLGRLRHPRRRPDPWWPRRRPRASSSP